MSNVRRVFADICRGYSTMQYEGKTLYIKHLGHIDQVDLDEYTEKAKADAKKKGISSTAEKLVWLNEKKLWTAKDEEQLGKLKKGVENMVQTRNKLFIPSDKDRMDVVIADQNKKINSLSERRGRLLGLTQERYSQNQTLVYYMFLSLYKDRELEERALTIKDIANIDDDELNDILYAYNASTEFFDENGIKKVAISDAFTSYFFNCGEDVNTFFPKCVSQWSFHQLNLIFWGRYFKSILQHNPNLPKEIREDPDKIEDYINSANKAKEIVNQGTKRGQGEAGTQFVGIVGSADDLKKMGLKADHAPVKLVNGNIV